MLRQIDRPIAKMVPNLWRNTRAPFVGALAAAIIHSPAWAQPTDQNSPYLHMYGQWNHMMGGPMMGWGGGMFGGIGMLFFWAVIIVVIYLLARGHIGSAPSKSLSQPPRSGSTPFDILQERFAKGEIDKEEYLDRKKTLSE